MGYTRNVIVVLLSAVAYCYLSPFYQKVNPVSYKAELPEKLEGPLSPNNLLTKIERLHENNVIGAESFAAHKGRLYSGLGDGRIVQIAEKEIITVCRLTQSRQEKEVIGRPFGLAFNKAGRLFVADAYLGLFEIDVKTGEKIQLLSSETTVDNSPLTFLNSLAFDQQEESIYITQSSSKWSIDNFPVGLFEYDTSGRLLKYDLKTKKISVALNDIALPNGIVLTHDSKALLIAEFLGKKIIKYHLKGEKKGLRENLPTTLPGEPDNIKRSLKGTYWISIFSPRTQDKPILFDWMSDKPVVRSLLIHAHRLLTAPIYAILDILPSTSAKDLSDRLGAVLLQHYFSFGFIIEFNEEGKILRSLQSLPGNALSITEAFEHDGFLYLGSYMNNYIGRLKA